MMEQGEEWEGGTTEGTEHRHDSGNRVCVGVGKGKASVAGLSPSGP